MKFIITFFILLIPTVFLAQNINFNNYTSLQSEGEIPEDFRTNFNEKVAIEKKKIPENSDSKIRKHQENFVLESNFILNQVLSSGKILFGDVLTVYVNKVADEVLKPFPELRKQLRFYVTKDVFPNAFSTDQGIIFINLGLLARLENEAQLAYIISHEVVHFAKQHSINIYVEEKSGEADKKYKNTNNLDQLFMKNFRSKEVEKEADLEGFTKYFSLSGYNSDGVYITFNLLQFAELSMVDYPIDIQLFGNKNYSLPKKYYLTKIDEYYADDNYNDSLSTHPNVLKRRELMKSAVDGYSQVNKADFIVADSLQFVHYVDIARFELLDQLIKVRKYVEAIYYAIYIQKKFPDSKYLARTIGYCLYALSTYKVKSRSSDVVSNYKNYVGSLEMLYYFFSKITSKELNVISLDYNYKMYRKYNEQFDLAICDRLFYNLLTDSRLSSKDFYDKPYKELLQQKKSESINDSIKFKLKKAKPVKVDTSALKYALIDEMTDEFFVKRFDLIKQKLDSIELIPLRKRQTKTYDVNKVIINKPFLVKVDLRKKNDAIYSASEIDPEKLKSLIEKNAKIAKIEIAHIDNIGLKSQETERYNDFCNLNEWLEERFESSDVNLIPQHSAHIDSIIERNGSQYVAYPYIITAKQRKNIPGIVFKMLLVFPMPFAFNDIFTNNSTFFYYYVFDLNSGKPLLEINNFAKRNTSNTFLNSRIYDAFYQTKKLSK